jgi:cytochrome c5
MHSTKVFLRRSVSKSLSVLLVCGITLGSICVAAASRDGETVYHKECASCHETVAPRMPSKTTLAERSPQAIVKALETGTMRVVGTFNLNGPERVAVAE